MMSLLEKASIITTPTAYDDGKLLSVKPVKTFGSELVTNGDFSDGTNNWSVEGFSNISVGDYEGRTDVANINISNTATTSRIRQPFNYVNGKKYKVSVDVFVVSGSFRIDCSDSFVSGDFVSTSTTGSWLTLTAEIEAISTGSNYIWLRGLLEVSQFYVDNVSVKEVIDADFDFTRGSSATRVNEQGLIQDVQILSRELVQNGDFEQIGSELVTNGGFDTDSDWSKYYAGDSNSITIANGVLSFNSNTNQNVFQTISSSNLNGFYKITYTITSYTRGNPYFLLGGGSNIYLGSTVGTHTKYVQGGGSNANLIIYGGIFGQGGELSIDNVSVKEVGQNWTFGTDWSMGDNKAVRTGTTSSGLTQSGSFNNNKKYKLEFTISDYVSGSIKGEFSGGGGSDVFFTSNNIGNGTFSFITETTTNRTNLQFYAFNSFSGSIDNISLIEITDDTDLPRINYTNFDYKDVLGDELVTNGSFDTDLSGWTNSNNHWQWTSQGAYFPLISTHNPLTQILTNTVGVKLKITFTLNIIQGTANFYYYNINNLNISRTIYRKRNLYNRNRTCKTKYKYQLFTIRRNKY